MIYEKQDLLAPLGEGMLAAPHPMVPGTEDTSYYRGEVTGPVPKQIDWVAQWRPEDPSLVALRPSGRRVPSSNTRSDNGEVSEPMEHGQPAELDHSTSQTGTAR